MSVASRNSPAVGCPPTPVTFPSWSSPTALSFTTGLPASAVVRDVAWSPDGRYAVAVYDRTSYITVYERVGDTFTAVGSFDTGPTGNNTTGQGSWSAAFSPDGSHLAAGHYSTPFFSVWKRTGTAYAKLADPASLPTATGIGIAWSPTGDNIAVVSQDAQGIYIYTKDAAGTLTKQTNPTATTGVPISNAAYSPSGQYVALGTNSTPFVQIYSKAGSTYTKLSDPASLPAGAVNGVAWSPNGRFLACGHGTSPYVTVYRYDGGSTFTKLADPASLPPGTVRRPSWSPDSRYLFCPSDTTPYNITYRVESNLLVQAANLAATPADLMYCARVSPQGDVVAYGCLSSPFLYFEKTAG